MNNLIPAIMRTGVPIIYALLIKLGVSRLGLPDTAVTDIATVLLTVLLYAALWLLERVRPWIGWALGWAKQPQYADVVEGEVTSVHDELLKDLHAQVVQLKGRVADVAKAIDDKVDATVQKATPAASATVPVVGPSTIATVEAATKVADTVAKKIAAAAPGLDTKHVPELRTIAKDLTITGYSSMTKAELITAIKATQKAGAQTKGA